MNVRMIAKLVGCSPSTVSRVLSGRLGNVRVGAATEAAIRRVCAELGYEPNIHATRLFSKQTRVIGLLTPPGFLADPNLARFSAALYKECSDYGYRLLLLVHDGAFVKDKQYLSVFRQREIDALVIWGVDGDTSWLRELGGPGYPVILGANRAGDLPSITCDEEAGIGAMVQLCRKRRAVRFLYVGGEGTEQLRRRRAAFMMAAAGSEVRLLPGEGGITDGMAAIPVIREYQPQAVICVNDMTAVGVLQGMRSTGVQVPRDLMVTGADDISLAEFFEPPLTTYDQMAGECGRLCGEELLLHLRDGSVITSNTVPVQLRLRGTV